MSVRRLTEPDDFWSRVSVGDASECWPWRLGTRGRGYGRAKYRDLVWPAHRLAYVLTNGEVPEGKVLDHLCRNVICCNPGHLEPVTVKENVLRGVGPTAVNAAKTECIHGHALSGPNLYLHPRGYRYCRTCRRAGDRARRAKPRLAHLNINQQEAAA